MGILVNKAALEAFKLAPQSDLLIRFANGPGNPAADHYCETGQALIALFVHVNISRNRQARVVWTGHPMPSAAQAADVANAVRNYFDALRMVQVYRGAAAQQAAQALGAQAFAVGGGNVFGASPQDANMAHEATHVMQQRGGGN